MLKACDNPEVDADRAPRRLLWKDGVQQRSRRTTPTADGPTWFSILTIASNELQPLPLAVYVGNRRHLFASVWLHLPGGDIPTQAQIDSCTRSLNYLHLDRKMDFISFAGNSEEDADDMEALHMDFTAQLNMVDAMTGSRSAFCIRRVVGGELALICALRNRHT